MKRLRVGVVGIGSIGSQHARVFAESGLADFTAVYDPNNAAAAEVASRLGARAASSLDEFVSLVDAATVATPTPTHFEIARHLLQSGKHVLVEKPITEKTADARVLSELAHEKKLVLQVGHIERFNPVLGALETRLTRPRFIESHGSRRIRIAAPRSASSSI